MREMNPSLKFTLSRLQFLENYKYLLCKGFGNTSASLQFQYNCQITRFR